MIHPLTAFLIGLVTAPPAQHSTQHRTRTRLNTKAAVARLPSHRRIVASPFTRPINLTTHRMQHQPPPCISSAQLPLQYGPPPSTSDRNQANPPAVAILLINAVAILSEDRFLARINLSPASYDPAFGQGADASVKAKIINLIASVRTLMRIPLIGINTIVILYELVLG
ncbi:Meiotically up-regulated protein [Verticillium dahliae VDG1]|nr:Meiotically up-regulated protein [Verticillium dahliae VDG1]